MRRLAFVLFAALSTLASAQSAGDWRAQQRAAAEKSEGILRQTEKMKGLLAQYQLMRAAYDADESKAFRLIFGQYLSWHQSYLGLYSEARASFSIKQEAEKDDAPSPLGQGGYGAQPAVDAIAKLAHGRKAIFLNEAHNIPMTRSVTVQLLAKLRADGYTHFAAETLYETDKDLARRGYPTFDSGFYTQDPVYAEMVRTALKLGFKVVAYEAISEATGDAREREQARNLYDRVIKADPDARLVVNAGYAHIVESGKFLDGGSMAQHFKRLSSIDPLTVEQTMLIEHSIPAEDHPIYRAVMEQQHPTQATVFVDADGKPWTLHPGQYDVSVFFPRDDLRDGRPAWLALGGQRVPYAITGETCRSTFPCVVEARYANESDDAVPADRLVFGLKDLRLKLVDRAFQNAAEWRSALYLRPGKYRLSAVGTDNQAITRHNITVDDEGHASVTDEAPATAKSPAN